MPVEVMDGTGRLECAEVCGRSLRKCGVNGILPVAYSFFNGGFRTRWWLQSGAGGPMMKRKYKLDEIDCANCALKLENAIKEVNGVSNAKVNYMTQKLTLEADESEFEAVEKDVLAVCRRMEPDMDVAAV